jgi:hypothetical protein
LHAFAPLEPARPNPQPTPPPKQPPQGIPLTKLVESEAGKLLALADDLHKRIIGQNEAVRGEGEGPGGEGG